MSLLMWDPFRPSRIMDQQFGHGLDAEDLLMPLERTLFSSPAGYLRPWRTPSAARDSGSVVTADKDKFQVNLDVQHFKPEEIKLTASGNTLTIEGKHEEQQDEHGYISRHFVRKYVLPEGHDMNQVQSNLSSDGVLSIVAPKKAIDGSEVKAIPIQQTGKPSKPIENKEKK